MLLIPKACSVLSILIPPLREDAEQLFLARLHSITAKVIVRRQRHGHFGPTIHWEKYNIKVWKTTWDYNRDFKKIRHRVRLDISVFNMSRFFCVM